MKKYVMMMLALVVPLVALAHSHLESSVPAKGSTLKQSPDNVVLVFGDAVELTALTLQKAGEKTKRDLVPLPKEDSVHLSVPLPKLADGDYVLSYAVLSSDQHETRGTIAFKVAGSAK